MAQMQKNNDQASAEGSRRIVQDELDRRNDGRSPTDASTDEQLNDADDIPQATLQEAAREHADTYVVKTDLEDADQRSIPGTREQP